jgi:hypothetical protein
VDPFVGRAFGRHYDAQNPWDTAFIDLVARLNDILINCGYIKPTQMFAVMTTDTKALPVVYGNRTPTFCRRSA